MSDETKFFTTCSKLLNAAMVHLELLVDAMRTLDEGEQPEGANPLDGWDSMALNTMRGRALAAHDILEAVGKDWRGGHLLHRIVEVDRRNVPTI